ncbi:MAG TPA: glycogen debranching N-terminal domain-containing protein, partial [Propionibacteriaceae bacterium]
MPQRRQPFLHDLVTVLAAPTQVWSAPDGSVRSTASDPGVQGVLHADVRVLNRIEVQIDGQPGEHIATALEGQQATFTHLLRHIAPELATTPDPQLRLDRVRSVEPGSVEEWLTVSSLLGVPVTVEVSVAFGCDFAGVEVIKRGEAPAAVAYDVDPGGDEVVWSSDDLDVSLSCAGAEWSLSADRAVLTATWQLSVPAHGESSVSWELGVVDRGGVVGAALSAPLPAWTGASNHHRLQPWLDRSLADLNSLAMVTPDHPDDVFIAAGAPWYLTLFGRDSIWAARRLIPVDLSVARGTLRTLGRLQGSVIDTETSEEPGKIMHELR